MDDAASVSKEQLLADMRVVVGDLEAMLKATAGSADAEVRALGEGLRMRLAEAKNRMLDAEHAMLETGLGATFHPKTYERVMERYFPGEGRPPADGAGADAHPA